MAGTGIENIGFLEAESPAEFSIYSPEDSTTSPMYHVVGQIEGLVFAGTSLGYKYI